MSHLKEIYQQTILDHYRRPRNFAALESANRHAGGHNPLCGDRVEVFLKVDQQRVQEIAFQGAGCAISTASASLMTEAVKGKTLEEIDTLFQAVHTMLTTGDDDATTEVDLGKLEALSGVRHLPVRIKCAVLAWHTLKAALQESAEKATVSTE